MSRRTVLITVLTASLMALPAIAGCAGGTKTVARETPVSAGDARAAVVVAVSPAVQDSGIADQIQNGFAATYPQFRIRVVQMSPKAAVTALKNGQADVMIEPDTPDVAAFVGGGFASSSKPLMQDSAVIIGPKDDPAQVRSASSPSAALAGIAARASGLSSPGEVPVRFYSGGASSATAALESALWKQAGARTDGSWFTTVEGSPRALVFEVAKGQGYAIIERAEFLALSDTSGSIKVLRSTGQAGVERYAVITAAGAQDADAAGMFVSWLKGAAGQAITARTGVSSYGEPLFTPSEP